MTYIRIIILLFLVPLAGAAQEPYLAVETQLQASYAKVAPACVRA